MNGTAQDADRQLHELRAAQDAATTNLLDLEADGTYALLKAGGGLSGVTAAKAKPALARVPELWRWLELLDSLLDRATAVRGADKARLPDAKAKELLRLLTTDSISLPADPLPLAQRGLTTSPDTAQTITPRDLLAAMEVAFTPLRDVVAEVEAAWRELVPRLERATAEAGRLAHRLPDHRGVAAARSALAKLAGRVAEDPLGATAELQRAEADLAAVSQAAADVQTRAAHLRDDLVAATRTIAELERLLDEGHDGLVRTRADIADPQGLLDPLDPGILTGDRGLGPWLARLEDLVAAGDAELARRGFARWRELADKTLAAARQVAEANAGPARRRQELRGLLRAARAKASASGFAEDPAVTELANRARRSLAVPCDLAAAEAHVAAYLDELRRTRVTKEEPT